MMAKQRRALMRVLKNERARRIWGSITVATALPFFVAYGDRSSPFATDNLILTGSLAVWLLLDEIVEQFTGRKAKKNWADSAANTWAYLAPFGNALTDWLLYHNGQYQRFVSGITLVATAAPANAPAGAVLTASVPITVGSNYQSSFNGLDNVAVAATVVSFSGGAAPAAVTASVAGGILTVWVFGTSAAAAQAAQSSATATSVNVAYVVDTQAGVTSGNYTSPAQYA
jgi:hypothetical protein